MATAFVDIGVKPLDKTAIPIYPIPSILAMCCVFEWIDVNLGSA
jgi:hypothetical protein